MRVVQLRAFLCCPVLATLPQAAAMGMEQA